MSLSVDDPLSGVGRSSDARRPVGVRGLDSMLGGGLPSDTTTLVCGPPFTGKTTLLKRSILAGLRQGVPSVILLTDACADRFRKQLVAMDEDYLSYEADGLVRYVDTYSRSVDAEEVALQAQYLDGASHLDAIEKALDRARRSLGHAGHDQHRFVVDSLSTLLLANGADAMLPFLQGMLGRAERAGGTTLLSLEHGVHPSREIELVRHLADGAIELRTESDDHQLRAIGPHVADARKWVEYEWGGKRFEVTGSASSVRIQ